MAAERKRFYLKNGALLQEKLISLSNGKYNPFRVYSIEEIEKATNNYDPQLIFCANFNFFIYHYYRGSLEGRNVTIAKSRSYNRAHRNPSTKLVSDIAMRAQEHVNDIAMTAQLSTHRNILKLVGCCLETEVPIVVYESVDNGNLSDRINHFPKKHDQPIPWRSRLSIAREIAHAVAYLHTAFSRPIVHLHIMPQNVFLDESNRAKLANFSEAVSIPEGETIKLHRFIWSDGYRPPEFRSGLEVTEKVDVYCFGTFLLEILTGRESHKLRDLCKRPHHFKDWIVKEPFLDNFIKYFITCHSIDEIVDPTILNEGRGFHVQQQWKAMVDLALCCLETEKDKRPTMVEVAKKLGYIERSSTIASDAGTERSFFEEARMLTDEYSNASNNCKYPITRRFSAQQLKNATDNYCPDNIFGCTRLGVWYNGSLEGQSVSICKISSFNWHENVNYEFKIAAELDAHENILKLLGCCLETSVPILVYESAENGSLHEHIEAISFEVSLPQQMMWSRRLRIASQIAHGVAHLHATGNVILGKNINLTSIFLDEHYTAKISNPLCSVPREGSNPYDPKDDDISEKIDVHFFGLLVLELLSGRPRFHISDSGFWSGDLGFGRMKCPSILYLKNYLRCLNIDDLVDPRILMEEGEGNQKNMYQQWQDVVELIGKCLEVEKERRPKMAEVAQQLEEIQRSSTGRYISVTGNKTMFLDKFVSSCNFMRRTFCVFSATELKQATDNYDSKRIFKFTNLGVWFKGQLGKRKIFVCKISPMNWEEHVKNEFDIAVKLRGRKHVLKLLGCCLETPVPALVYESAPEVYFRWLFKEIHSKSIFENSLKIARQVAREVAHLHTAFSSPIVHRNIKSANILLDKHYAPKLSNFSECISLHHGETRMTDKLERIKGYVVPEYMNEGIVTEKVDVYGFGVLLIELFLGRKLFGIFDVVDKEGGFLLDHVKSYFKFPCIDETVNRIVERREGVLSEQKQWKSMVKLAFKCLEVAKEERPTMTEIVKELDRI